MRVIIVYVCTVGGPPDGVRHNPAKLGEGLQQLCLAGPAIQLQTGRQSRYKHVLRRQTACDCLLLSSLCHSVGNAFNTALEWLVGCCCPSLEK